MGGAGAIDRDWFENASVNGDVAEWFATVINAAVEVQEDLTVWVPSRSCWLSQEAIDEACKRIDKGV